MGRFGVWKDAANWDDRNFWRDGAQFNFTAMPVDTNNDAGDIVGTITPLTGGGAITYTLADTFGDMFALDGANVVLGTSIVIAGSYSLVANAVNASGWAWSVPCLVRIAEAEIILPLASFSRQPQIGVPLTDVVIEGIPEEVSVISNVPGVTVDDSVRPVVASGTPTVSGTVSNALVTMLGSATRANDVEVLEGAPTITVQPSQSGPASVGQAQVCEPGAAPGAGSIPSYRWFYRPGTSGNGAAVDLAYPGSFSSSIIPSVSGGQYRCRVTWFRGVLGTQAFTDWSPTIAAAVETVPSFSSATSYSGGAFVGDTLTVAPGNGTGTVSVIWTANNVPIPGETGLTYQLRWSDWGKGISPVVSRTIGDLTVVDTTPLLSTLVYPNLSGAYFGNPSWYDGSTMRYMTPVLVTPYEPGVGGTAKVTAASSSRQRTFDQRIDVYYRGSLHWGTPGTPIGNAISNGGARNALYMGFNTDGYKTQHIRANGKVHFLSLGSNTPRSQDQVWYGGSPTHPLPGYQTTYIQGCRLTPLGSYANYWIVPGNQSSGINEFDVVSIVRTSTNTVEITIDLSSRPTYTTSTGAVIPARDPVVIDPETGKAGFVIIYNAEVTPGVVNAPNVDWCTNYDITAWDPETGKITAKTAMDPSDFTPTVGSSAVARTGKCVVMIKKPDNHGDGGQKNEGVAGPTYRHCNTYLGNYTVHGMDGNYASSRNSITLSCENIRRLLTFNPQEWRAQLIYFQLSAGSTFAYELTNIYINYLWAKVSLKSLVLPVRDDPVVLPNGNQILPMGTDLYPNAIGGVELADVPDYVPAVRDFWNFAPTFHGQRNPTNADLTGITLTPTAWSAGAPIGTEVGQLILAHLLPDGLNDASGRPVIVDFTVTGANAGKVSQGWSGILYTTATTGSSSFDIEVTAVVRDSAANYGNAVSHGPVTITISPS